MGPMKLAAMNGLTVSSGSILEVEPPSSQSSSRAPKDDRVGLTIRAYDAYSSLQTLFNSI